MEHLNRTVSPSQKCSGEEIEIHDIGKYDPLSSPPSIAEEVEESNICKKNILVMEEGNLYATIVDKSKITKTQFNMQKYSGCGNIFTCGWCIWRILCLILSTAIVSLLIYWRRRVTVYGDSIYVYDEK